MADVKIITDFSGLEKRPLAAHLKKVLDKESFKAVFARLANLYIQSQNKKYELQETLDNTETAVLTKALNQLFNLKIESLAPAKLLAIVPQMPWMSHSVHKDLVKNGLGRSISDTFDDALRERFPLHTFDRHSVTSRLDAFLGTEYGVVIEDNRYQDALLVRNYTQMSKRFENVLKIDIKETIWESIIRADVRLLYTYFACVLSRKNQDDVDILQSLVDLRFAMMSIGRKDAKKWTVLVEGKGK